MKDYLGAAEPVKSLGTDIPTLVALLVCLIPTTIGALLAAIGIAGMDRALRANILAKSGKAVEVAGDIDTLLLDKTGTITVGNRRATQFIPAGGLHRPAGTRRARPPWPPSPTRPPRARVSSNCISVRHSEGGGSNTRGSAARLGAMASDGARFIEFTAQTRMSGVDLPDGRQIRKGAPDTVDPPCSAGHGGQLSPARIQEQVNAVASRGATPLLGLPGQHGWPG